MRKLLLTFVLLFAPAVAHAQLVITPTPVPACTTGQTVVYDGANWNCQPVAATPISDAAALLKNSADATKLFRFSLGSITAGQTRVLTLPDYNLDLTPTNANRVLATGSAGAGGLTVRSLVAADIPALDASKITTGTFANARTTATNANTASAIVARDANGDFTARYVTADLIGNATTASSATTAGSVTNGVYTNGSYTDPAWLTITKAKVGLGNVENTALSTWAGTGNITTLGTVTTGVWSGTNILWSKVDKSGSTLGSIADVLFTLPVNGQILKFNGTNWVNGDPEAVAGHALLGSTHTDTVGNGASQVTRGALVVGNAAPAWQPLPIGANGTYLKSNGTDVSWATIPASNDASALTVGTLADARLSANVPLKNAANTFTANQLLSATRVELQLLHSGTAKTRVAQYLGNLTSITTNLSYNGSAQWMLDDTTLGGGILNIGPGFNYFSLTAGTNPRTPISVLAAGVDGITTNSNDRAISWMTTPGLTAGNLHIIPTTGKGDWGNSITFGANGGTTGGNVGTIQTGAHAGIYVVGSGSYGTKMAFATTDSFAAGAKTSFYIASDRSIHVGTNANGGPGGATEMVIGSYAGSYTGFGLAGDMTVNNYTLMYGSSALLMNRPAGSSFQLRENNTTHLTVATGGAATFSSSIAEYGRGTAMGHFVDVAAPSVSDPYGFGTWAWGSKVMYGYTLVGKQMTIYFNFQGMSSAGNPQAIRWALPGGVSTSYDQRNAAMIWDGGGSGRFAQVLCQSNYIQVSVFPDGSRFQSTGSMHIIGQVNIIIQ